MVLDRDISDKEWNHYMQKYEKQYRLVRDEIGIWGIKCRHGYIQPYSIVNRKLIYVATFKSNRGKRSFEQTCTKRGVPLTTTQDGEGCMSVVIPEDELPLYAPVCGVMCVRHLSEAQKAENVERLKKYWYTKKEKKICN